MLIAVQTGGSNIITFISGHYKTAFKLHRKLCDSLYVLIRVLNNSMVYNTTILKETKQLKHNGTVIVQHPELS